MGNPFLVIMAIVVAAVTAAFGIPQITGAIDDANDGAAVQDLGQIAIVQEAAYTKGSNYAFLDGNVQQGSLVDGRVKDGGTSGDTEIGMKFQQSGGTSVDVRVSTNKMRWAAISASRSGKVFVRTSDSTEVYESAEKITDSNAISRTITWLNSRGNAVALPSGVTPGGTLTAPTITVNNG